MPTNPSATVQLEFDPTRLIIGEDTDIRQGLSAVAAVSDTLWLACDEGCRLERLSRTSADAKFASHQVFPLEEMLALPADPSEEADIEGMDIDDGWLWLVGSHSVKRKKPKNNDAPEAVAKKLATLSRDGNRHLLARIPLVGDGLARQDGNRRAAGLAATAESSELLDAIAPGDAAGADPHLAAFVPLPGKDNGFDIEGLAARGMRLFVGVRGPVLREWSCILELQLEDGGDRLRLRRFDDGTRYRKHFLKLNGLGVRDLLVLNDDLLILAGPSMAHDGPHEIWRWRNALKAGAVAAMSDVKRLLALPQPEHVDRAEGFTAFDAAPDSVLVVFDTPSPNRLTGESSVAADVFRLP
jgi:hypothetical protein